MPEPYEYHLTDQPGTSNAVYKFTTKCEVQYIVTFIDVTLITDIFDDYPVLSNGLYFIIAVAYKPQGKQPFDSRIGTTICCIYKAYLEQYDFNSIIIYNCDENDGAQMKRYYKFCRWFSSITTIPKIEKIDREILIPQEDNDKGLIYVVSPLSILFSSEHPRKEIIYQEVEKITDRISGKDDIEIL